MTPNDQNRTRNNEILSLLASGYSTADVSIRFLISREQITRIAKKRIEQLGLQDSLFGGNRPKIRDIHAKGQEILEYLVTHPNS